MKIIISLVTAAMGILPATVIAASAILPAAAQESAEQIKSAAERGDANAQNELGAMYFMGRGGVIRNLSLAAQWWQKAAAQGHPAALRNLGFMYYYGQGLPMSTRKGLELYREAAARGDAEAKRFLENKRMQGEL